MFKTFFPLPFLFHFYCCKISLILLILAKDHLRNILKGHQWNLINDNHDSRVLIDMETSYCVTIKANILLDVFCFQVVLLLLFLWQRFQMRNFRKLPFLLLLTSFSSLVSNFFYFVILFTNNLLLPTTCL